MTGSTRRRFLIMTGAGAAAAGVAAAVPSAASAAAPAAQELRTPADAQPLVAHISDPASGTVSIMHGEHEVVVHDRDLVARLTRAAKGV